MIEFTSLEYTIVLNCNLTCLYCDHLSPYHDPEQVEVKRFIEDIGNLSRFAHVDTFKITGGEPLLHDRLCDIVLALRLSGLCRKIALYTNGTLLRDMDDKIWEVIDVLSVSIYPGIEHSTNWILNKCVEHNVHPDIKLIFRHQRRYVAAGGHDPEIFFRECKLRGEWNCNTVYNGRFYLCPMSSILDRDRGVKIDQYDAEKIISAYIQRKISLHACERCLGSSGEYADHRLKEPYREIHKK